MTAGLNISHESALFEGHLHAAVQRTAVPQHLQNPLIVHSCWHSSFSHSVSSLYHWTSGGSCAFVIKINTKNKNSQLLRATVNIFLWFLLSNKKRKWPFHVIHSIKLDFVKRLQEKKPYCWQNFLSGPFSNFSCSTVFHQFTVLSSLKNIHNTFKFYQNTTSMISYKPKEQLEIFESFGGTLHKLYFCYFFFPQATLVA